MVFIKNWTDFESATTDLYARSPNQVRYCVKFQPKTGHLVLKITDDHKCIKYKTFSSIILNRFDSLNLRLLSSMSNTRARPKLLPTASAAETPERGGTPAPAAAGADEQFQVGQNQSKDTAGGQAQGQGASNSGGNKKKKKKGKK